MGKEQKSGAFDRRDFFKTASAGVTAAAILMTPREAAQAQEAAQKAALDRIAANTYPIRPLFKQRPFGGPPRPTGDNAGNPAARRPGQGAGPRGYSPEDQAMLEKNPNAKRPLEIATAAAAARANLPNAQQMKQKYGEITMLDFPTFTKETFPGVTRMDLFSGLFGDISDDTMFFPGQNGRCLLYTSDAADE